MPARFMAMLLVAIGNNNSAIIAARKRVFRGTRNSQRPEPNKERGPETTCHKTSRQLRKSAIAARPIR